MKDEIFLVLFIKVSLYAFALGLLTSFDWRVGIAAILILVAKGIEPSEKKGDDK